VAEKFENFKFIHIAALFEEVMISKLNSTLLNMLDQQNDLQFI